MSCFECNSDYMIEQHHVVPKSIGGTKTIPLCIVCHGKVHDRNFVKHRELQRKGVEKAKAKGKYSGRKKGTGMTNEQIINKYNYVINCLDSGMSYRKTAEFCDVSLSTVQRVVKANRYLKDNKQSKSLIKRMFKL